MTNGEVARAAGITTKRYNNYVNGQRQPSLETMRAIAAALQTSVDDLISARSILESRDIPTFRAVRRFAEACLDLNGDDISFLADIAEAVRYRRHNDRWKLSPDRAEFLRVHDLLIPAITYQWRPLSVDTIEMDHEDGRRWLHIELKFSKDVSENTVKQALLRLAQEVLRKDSVSDIQVTSTSDFPFKRVVLRVSLG